MAHILLTGGRAPATLELARIFHSAGHQVFLAESQPGSLSEPSKAIKKHFHLPPPRQQRAAFIQALKEIIQNNKIDLLVPTCEEVFYVSMGLNLLAPLCQVFVDSIDRLQALHNKFTFIKLAQNYGLSVPDTRLIKNQDDLYYAYQRWPQLVLKPVYSRFATRTRVLPSSDKNLLPHLEDNGANWVAQEFIKGISFCTYSTAHDGHLTAHATYRSDFTAGQGATIVFKSCRHPGLFKWVETFTALYHFSGQIAFDFIETPDGHVYAIECNPRATSGTHLFTNNPLFSQAFLVPGLDTLSPAEDNPSYMLSAAMFLYALPDAFKTHRLQSWMDTFFSSQDVIFRWDDPLPALCQIRSLLNFIHLGNRLGISALQASTADIEWNGE
jgi:predicted ATP-grasp superfamily ATP-dependent carboligase